MAANFNIAVGATAPALTDIIQENGVPVNLTGASVRFRMRKVLSAVLTVDTAATVTGATTGNVTYSWATGDTTTEGEYVAWWQATLSNGKIHITPEFKVVVDALTTEGEGTELGEIAYQASQLMPVTWTALSRDKRYGDRMLRTRTDYVKYKLFATVSVPTAEATFYNPLVLDYVAKEVALQVIPAGIDYWMEQHISVQTTGTHEAVTYPDRINALEKLQEWLLREVRDLRPQLDGVFTPRKRGRLPGVSNDDVGVITPNPQDFGEMWDEGIPKNLPWGPSW
jgi:hypothetical protein